MENKYITHTEHKGAVTSSLVGAIVVASFILMLGNLISSQEVHPDFNGPINYADLNEDQLTLMESFKYQRRLVPATLADNREVLVSESEQRIYSETPSEWYRNDGDLKLTKTEQAQLAAFTYVTLPGGIQFEPPLLAYQYNGFLKTIHSFSLFGILFGAVFRFDLGNRKHTYRNIAIVPLLGIVGSLFYGSFGLAATGAFIVGGIVGYLLLTLTSWATALIKFPIPDQAANPAKKKIVKVNTQKKGIDEDPKETFGEIQKAVQAAATT